MTTTTIVQSIDTELTGGRALCGHCGRGRLHRGESGHRTCSWCGVTWVVRVRDGRRPGLDAALTY